MASGKMCEALYDYQAVDSEELTISKGEKLRIVKSDGTWWEVTNDRQKTGLVPCNYVKECPAPVQPVQQQQQPVQFRTRPEDQAGMYQQTDLVRTNSLNIPAIAKYKYAAIREDELALEKGDSLVILEKEQDGWWRGRCGSRIGWFPFNYVEEVPASTSPVIPEQKEKKTVICTVVALYPFNSGNPEELAFNKGDILEIIDQPADDPDWWEAKMEGDKTGLIPRNYVEMVTNVKPSTPIGGGGGAGMNPGGGGMNAGGWSGPSSSPQASPLLNPSNSTGVMGGGGGMGVPMASGGISSAPFSHESWYFGKVSRKVAERRLTSDANNGMFLVRDSETKPGDYSISMKAPDRIKHFNIKSLPDGRYGIGQRKFDSMDELIKHYKRAPIYTSSADGKIYLTEGLTR